MKDSVKKIDFDCEDGPDCQTMGFDIHNRLWVFVTKRILKVIEPKSFKIFRTKDFESGYYNYLVAKQLKNSPFMVFLLGKRLCFTDTSPPVIHDVQKPMLIDQIHNEVENYFASNNFVCGFGSTLYSA